MLSWDVMSRSHLASTMSEISVGGKVRLIAIPPYLKTADPMPMLRPPELLNIDDIGTVIDRRRGLLGCKIRARLISAR